MFSGILTDCSHKGDGLGPEGKNVRYAKVLAC